VCRACGESCAEDMPDVDGREGETARDGGREEEKPRAGGERCSGGDPERDPQNASQKSGASAGSSATASRLSSAGEAYG
jgi:hypothetical protein